MIEQLLQIFAKFSIETPLYDGSRLGARWKMSSRDFERAKQLHDANGKPLITLNLDGRGMVDFYSNDLFFGWIMGLPVCIQEGTEIRIAKFDKPRVS